MNKHKYGRYEFTITIAANGNNPEEAWKEACESFQMDWGCCPEDYEFVDEE